MKGMSRLIKSLREVPPVLIVAWIISFILPIVSIEMRATLGRASAWRIPVLCEPLMLLLIWHHYRWKLDSLGLSLGINLSALALGGSLAFLTKGLIHHQTTSLIIGIKWLAFAALFLWMIYRERREISGREKKTAEMDARLEKDKAEFDAQMASLDEEGQQALIKAKFDSLMAEADEAMKQSDRHMRKVYWLLGVVVVLFVVITALAFWLG
jgi:Ca2+/Na+ antiporter